MVQKETEPDVVQRQRTKGAKGWETEGKRPCPANTLLKLLMKDKLLYSRKVRERRETKPSKEREMRLQRIRDRQAAENSEERDWRLHQTRTNQHAKLAVETRRTWLHWICQHALLVKKDFLTLFHPKLCVLIWRVVILYPPMSHSTAHSGSPQMLCIYTSSYSGWSTETVGMVHNRIW